MRRSWGRAAHPLAPRTQENDPMSTATMTIPGTDELEGRYVELMRRSKAILSAIAATDDLWSEWRLVAAEEALVGSLLRDALQAEAA